jgi:hypothetical protein
MSSSPIIDKHPDAPFGSNSHTALSSAASPRRSAHSTADAVVPALSNIPVGEFPTESKHTQPPSLESETSVPDEFASPKSQHNTRNQVRVQVQDGSEIMSSVSEQRFAQLPKKAGAQDEEDDSSMLGQGLKRRLMDIESSFIPDGGAAMPTTGNSAGPSGRGQGADDTFLFGGSPGRTGHLAKTSPPQHEESEVASSVMLPSSPAAAAMQRVMNKGNGRSSQPSGLNFGKGVGEDEEKYVST